MNNTVRHNLERSSIYLKVAVFVRPTPQTMDMISASRNYIDKIVGHKALRKEANVGKVMLLDGFTTQVVQQEGLKA